MKYQPNWRHTTVDEEKESKRKKIHEEDHLNICKTINEHFYWLQSHWIWAGKKNKNHLGK